MDLTISYGDFKRVLTIKIKEMMYYLSSSHTTSNFQDPIKIMPVFFDHLSFCTNKRSHNMIIFYCIFKKNYEIKFQRTKMYISKK